MSLVNSRTLQANLAKWSREDGAEYKLEYNSDAQSYRFVARKVILGEPLNYSIFIQAETLEGTGPVSVLANLRERSMQKLFASGAKV